MLTPNKFAVCLGAAMLLTAGDAKAVVVAQYDLAKHQSSGFAFGDFNDFFALDTTGDEGNFIRLNAATDLDPENSNGIFGGMGSDVTADFEVNSSQIEVTLRVNAENLAGSFNVVLTDYDTETTGDEFQYSFDISGVTPGEFVTLVQPLSIPGPVYNQAAHNKDIGDEIPNYDLRQIQLQSAYGGTDALVIDLESIKISDTDNPVLFDLTPETYATIGSTFTFGTFDEANQPGAFDASGENFVIQADSAGARGATGGFGSNGISIDFDATQFQLEVEAKLLPENTSEGFNLILGDDDGDQGDDGTPDREDYSFFVETSQLNTSEFTTITIPLGSGSETGLLTSYESDPGDGLQNFGLFQMQIQSSGEDHPGLLGLEVARMSLVERPGRISGDFNGDGVVDAADYTVYRDNFGQDDSVLGGAGDGSGTVDEGDYAVWRDAYGSAAATSQTAAAPEPGALSLLALMLTGSLRRRRQSTLAR